MTRQYRMAINGYGRIGRCVMRALHESRSYPQLEIVAVNDVTDARTLAHLTRYDSTHGRFVGDVVLESDDRMVINGQPVTVLRQPDIEQLPWQDLGVDLVLECSGRFSDRATAELHLQAGASR